MATVTGYCVRCKASRTIKGAKLVDTKGGGSGYAGACEVCDTKMFRMVRPPEQSAAQRKESAKKAAATKARRAGKTGGTGAIGTPAKETAEAVQAAAAVAVAPTPTNRRKVVEETAEAQASVAKAGSGKSGKSKSGKSKSGKSSSEGSMDSSKRWTVGLGARPVVDLDDSDLWAVARGLHRGLLAFQGSPPVDALIAQADAAAARYEAGGTEHGPAGKTEKLEELGEQLARVFVLYLLSKRVGWDAVRPPALDLRSTAERVLDAGLSFVQPVAGTVIPDAIDPTLQGGFGGAAAGALGGFATALNQGAIGSDGQVDWVGLAAGGIGGAAGGL